MAENDSVLDEHKQLARRIPTEIASKGAIEVIDEIFADDVVARTSHLGNAHGRDAFRELPQRMRGAFPDLEATVEEIIAEDDYVAMRVVLTGTHDGQFKNLEPTGKSFEIEHAIFLRIEEGEIVELWGQLDTFGLLRQLGVIDQPA